MQLRAILCLLVLVVSATAKEQASAPFLNKRADVSDLKPIIQKDLRLLRTEKSAAKAKQIVENILDLRLRDQRGFYRHFPHGLHLEVRNPDLQSLLGRAAIGSPAQRIGYTRELKYLNEFARDGRFQILRAGEPVVTKLGRTEFDAVLRHRATRQILRVEVKEVRVTRSNIEKLKTQITKLGSESRRQNVRQIWVNRHAVSAPLKKELVAHARKYRNRIYDRVSTGPKTVADGRARSLASVIDQEDARLLRGATRNVRMAGRWVGRAGVVASVRMGAYSVYQWRSGQITTQEFASQGAGAVTAAGGAWAGAKGGAVAGAAIGSVIPVVGTAAGGLMGAFVGTIGGGIVGYSVGEKVVDAYTGLAPTKNAVRWLDTAQQQELFAFLSHHYSGLHPR